jgi:copper chaperone CopZ
VSEMAKRVFKVPDMHCSACVMRLEGLEDDLPGVKSARASYHKQTLEIEFDEKRVGEGEIVAAIQRLGYSPVPAA